MGFLPDIPSLNSFQGSGNEPDMCLANDGAYLIDPNLKSALRLLTFPLGGLIFLILVYKFVQRLKYWMHVKKGSKVARIAAIVLKEYRLANLDFNSPTRHNWSSAQDIDATTPLLCVACAGNITAMTPADTLQACSVCGVVSHDTCIRHVGDTCRPLSTIRSSQELGPPHYWVVTSTCKEERIAGEYISSDAQPCIYCGEGVSGEVYAMEPSWCCTCCACCTHVQCFCIAHPELSSVSTSFESTMKKEETASSSSSRSNPPLKIRKNISSDTNSGMTPLQLQKERRIDVIKSASILKLDTCSLGTLGKMVVPSNCVVKIEPQPRKASSFISPLLLSPRRTFSGELQLQNSTLSSATSPAATMQTEHIDDGNNNINNNNNNNTVNKDIIITKGRDDQDDHTTDTTTTKDNTTTTTNNNNNSSRAITMNEKYTLASTTKQDTATASSTPPISIDTTLHRSIKRRKSSTSLLSPVPRRNSWWHRGFAPRPLAWQDWKLTPLPSSSRPVLVFINVRSGPRVGEDLRRRFLRVLHPLQVVTLPKETPEHAIRLFMSVPGLRILCVGGDGTAGWIMSCLDDIAEDVRKKSVLHCTANNNDDGTNSINDNTTSSGGGSNIEWVPPPVALMPLGTGNDLARCLGWGGGYRMWRHDGPLGILDEVSQAAIDLLDRWTLTFIESGDGDAKQNDDGTGTGISTGDTTHPPATTNTPADTTNNNNTDSTAVDTTNSTASTSTSLAIYNMAFQRALVSSPIPVPNPPQSSTPTTTTTFTNKISRKIAMSNYLGIGVDAKVALEFHEMRESYPQWFQSQIGNRLVYTGVGALDIVGVVGGGQLTLREKMTVECDGTILSLPQGAEGILIVNIPSYMGGVDLWASGGGGVIGKQSMNDGMLEVVAVYGSWHLGQLTVGLSGAVRLRQAHSITVTTKEKLPMQVDGEPFMQPAGKVQIELQGRARVLRKLESKPVARVVGAIEDVLEEAVEKKVISRGQHDQLSREMAARLQLHHI